MFKRLRTFGVGLAVGAGLGAVTSLLLAPDSGENLREQAKRAYKHVLLESAEAAEAKRQQLRAELEAMTSAPSDDSTA